MKWATMLKRRDCLFFLAFVVSLSGQLPAASKTLYYDDEVCRRR